MKVRVAEPEEFERVAAATGQPTFPDVRPEDISQVVVEDDSGEIVGALRVLNVRHFEGVWIDPKHRNAGTVRSLLGTAEAIALCRGSRWVFAGAADDRMRGILARMGAQRIPMDTYVLRLGGEACPQQ